MGRPDFGQLVAYPAPPITHTLHDNNVDADVVEGDLSEAVDDGLPVELAAELKLETTFH